MQKISEEYKDKGLQVIGISVFETHKDTKANPREKAQRFKETHKLTYPILLDVQAVHYKKFGRGAIPYNVIIDPNLTVRYSRSGFNKKEIIRQIGELLDRAAAR